MVLVIQPSMHDFNSIIRVDSDIFRTSAINSYTNSFGLTRGVSMITHRITLDHGSGGEASQDDQDKVLSTMKKN
jgi:hypothetical protein